MRLPDFLIIGAMKAGTTSLFSDLMTNPAVFMPYRKEPANLVRDDVCTPRGRLAFSKLFKRARPDQICGLASTAYAKLPDLPGVPQRAHKVLGSQVKVIYLVREPVSRIVSHHHHEIAAGTIACGVDEAVRVYPRFINYSRYAMQITPWIEMFGPKQVLILRFETYIKDRRGVVESVCRFLGIEPRCDLVRADIVYNRSEGKPVPRGPFGLIRNSSVYRNLVRPNLTRSARQRLRVALLPKAPPRPEPPSIETVRYIIDRLREDTEQLRAIMGCQQPLWDLQDVLHRSETQQTLP